MADARKNDSSFRGKPIPSKGLVDYRSKGVDSLDSPSVIQVPQRESGIGGTGSGRGVPLTQSLKRRFYPRIK